MNRCIIKVSDGTDCGLWEGYGRVSLWYIPHFDKGGGGWDTLYNVITIVKKNCLYFMCNGKVEENSSLLILVATLLGTQCLESTGKILSGK